MAEKEPAGDGVELLWPTVFMRRTLPGHELANKALAAFILELDEKKPGYDHRLSRRQSHGR